MAAQVPPALGKVYTRDEVDRLENLGLLTGRYELIEGELIDKMGQNPPHAYVLARMMAWLSRYFGHRLRCQSPIEVSAGDQRFNEPQPDLALVAEDKDAYFERHPRGGELALLIEVSDSSARFDLTTKARLYARAGVPEYWVIDIPRRQVTVHRQPAEGAYAQIEQLEEQECLSIQGAAIRLSELLH